MVWNDGNDDDRRPNNKPNDKPDSRPNPWGKPQDTRPDDDGESIWGGNRGNRSYKNSDEIDLDELISKFKRQFGNFLPDGKNRGIGKIGGLIGLVVVIMWLLSGIYFVQPNENGVVLTFGKYTRTDEMPGIKWKMPWPFQTVSIVDVTTERRVLIGYKTSSASHQDSLMLTGDENIVDIDFVVLWRIQDAKDYLFSIRDPEETINMVAASVVREIVGQTDLQPVLTDERNQVQVDAKAMMQKLLDEYHAGVTINNVQLQNVNRPEAVLNAFKEVQEARQEKDTLKNQAEAYRNDILPRAKGQAEKLRQDAEAYKAEVVSRSTGDAKRFDEIYAAYKSAKDVTAERMYLEAMEDVLNNAKTVVMGSDKGGNILPILPLNNGVPLQPAAGASPSSFSNTQR